MNESQSGGNPFDFHGVFRSKEVVDIFDNIKDVCSSSIGYVSKEEWSIVGGVLVQGAAVAKETKNVVFTCRKEACK